MLKENSWRRLVQTMTKPQTTVQKLISTGDVPLEMFLQQNKKLIYTNTNVSFSRDTLLVNNNNCYFFKNEETKV